jgi:two-component system, OmpR family, copper resistance phosphate regulon response regulator CusR
MKALLVEDDSSIRNVLRIGLKNHSFAVDEAENGDVGSYLARINQYDVIILDNVLPKKMAKDVCAEIRAAKVTTPIILLSGTSDVLNKIHLLRAGADDYITKPFSFEELLARITAVTRRPHSIVDAIFVMGPLKLNTHTQEVTRNGVKIFLTRKEFAILELLMRHEHRTVSRSMIMEHAWNQEVNAFSNTVEAHILNIRRKIGDKKRVLLQNVPGRGYKMVRPRNE